MKKIISLFLVLIAIVTLVSCKDNKILSTPTNISLSEQGLISWDPVANATSYVVLINGESITVDTPFYLVNDLKKELEEAPQTFSTWFLIAAPKVIQKCS